MTRIGLGLMIVFITQLSFAEGAKSAPQTLIFNTQEALYISDDGGIKWNQIPLKGVINRNTYLTASARHPQKPDVLLIGTSFDGIYESTDRGKTWKEAGNWKTLKPLYQQGGYFDEVAALAYPNPQTTDFAFRIGFGGASWLFERQTGQLKPWTEAVAAEALPAGMVVPVTVGADLPLTKDQTNPANGAARRKLAENRRGIYLNTRSASGAQLDRMLDFVVRNGMNMVTVDFKDDDGFLTYNSQLPIPLAMRAVRQRFDATELIKKAHAKQVSVVARVVVFKDKQLYGYQKNAYALWDRKSNKAYGVYRQEEVPPVKPGDKPTTVAVQTEFWVDPYAPFVHDYNIALAKEIEGLGADEIQWDYIRFPSDGDQSAVLARFHLDPDGKTNPVETARSRVVALGAFLAKARDAITIPMGTDVFGFNDWARMSYLGQDIQVISRYVDVICPMNYPSHYDRTFLGIANYFDWAATIYKESTRRARIITEDRVLIRPYAQAFLLGGELKFPEAMYYDYLNRQIIASKEGGGSGFTLWNYGGDYYMVQEKTFKTLTTN